MERDSEGNICTTFTQIVSRIVLCDQYLYIIVDTVKRNYRAFNKVGFLFFILLPCFEMGAHQTVKSAHAESTFIYLVFTAKCFHSVNEEYVVMNENL